MDLGHWEFPESFNPDDWFGFVYRVTNLNNGKQYIGRKQFNNYTRRKVANRKNRKKVITESNWREYTTSSKKLNEDIEKLGKNNFKFEIIELCKTKGELTFREVETQWEEKVLSATLPDGSPKFYNGNIGAVKFRLNKHSDKTIQEKFIGNKNPKGCSRSEETRKKMSDAKRGVPKSEEHREKLRQANLGKKASDETKKKMSEAHSGRAIEWADKIAEAHRGKTMSDEAKKKMSMNNHMNKACIIDEIEYLSQAAAARELGLSEDKVRSRVKSKNFPSYRLKD